jgi:hypothetical protein
VDHIHTHKNESDESAALLEIEWRPPHALLGVSELQNVQISTNVLRWKRVGCPRSVDSTYEAIVDIRGVHMLGARLEQFLDEVH